MPGLYNERRLVEKPIPNDRPNSSSLAQTDHFLNAIQPNDSDSDSVSDSTSDVDSDAPVDAPIDAPSVAVIPRNAPGEVPGNAPSIAAIDAPRNALGEVPGNAPGDVNIKTETEPVLDFSYANNEELSNISTPLTKAQEPPKTEVLVEVDENCIMICSQNQFPQPKAITCDGLIKQNNDDISADQPFTQTVR